MAALRACKECGRMYEPSPSGGSASYCSEGCMRKARAANSADSGRKMNLVILIVVGFAIIGVIGAAVNGIRNAFSDTKIKIVSASCETQADFESILGKALSEVSLTELEGEEFDTYSQQAREAVKEREGKYASFEDDVYFVRLPDNVNVYLWFKTKNKSMAFVYKINKTK